MNRSLLVIDGCIHHTVSDCLGIADEGLLQQQEAIYLSDDKFNIVFRHLKSFGDVVQGNFRIGKVNSSQSGLNNDLAQSFQQMRIPL